MTRLCSHTGVTYDLGPQSMMVLVFLAWVDLGYNRKSLPLILPSQELHIISSHV